MGTLTAALQALVAAGPSVLNPLAHHLNSSSSMTQSVDALLTQAQLNPALAPTIAAQIAAIPGVPAGVLPYVTEMSQFGPTAATDSSAKMGFVAAVTQAKAALATATSPGVLGQMVHNLGL
jgi:hypothetical protein